MPTILELGQRVKQKYPGTYDDLSDLEVGQRVKAKYPGSYDDFTDQIPSEPPKEGKLQSFLGGAASIFGGKELAKGAAQAIFSKESSPVEEAVRQAKTSERTIAQAKELPLGDPRRTQLLKQAHQQTTTQAGMAQENLEEIPTNKQVIGSAGKLGLTLGTLGTGGVATNLAGRAAESGIIGATYQALDNLENKEKVTKNVGTAAAVGAALPIAFTGASKIKRLFGKATQATGEKIQTTVIKPTAADYRDGFDIKTINKYNLGGNLKQMLEKTDTRLNTLATELNKKIKAGEAPIDLNLLVSKIEKDILSNKGGNFGNAGAIRRVLANIKEEVLAVSPTGIVDLPDAQVVKRAAGQKGAWVYGSPDPDATAIERVYTAFYRELKEDIERKAPEGVKEINKQISELIPVVDAIIRRIPVAERNNILGIGELVGLGTAAMSGIGGLGIIGASQLAKSGRFGSSLARAGSKIAQPTRLTKALKTTNIGRRLLGN